MWVGGMRMSTIATSGLYRPTCRSRSSALPDCAGDLEARFLEQPDDAFAQQDRVVGDDDPHLVAERRDRVAKRREVARETVGEQLEDALRARGARRGGGVPRSRIVSARTEPARVGAVSEDLPAVPGRADARDPVDVDAGVALVRDDRLARVQAHADTDRRGLRPTRARSAPRCADTAAATASSASTNTATAARRRARRPRRRRCALRPPRAGSAARPPRSAA